MTAVIETQYLPSVGVLARLVPCSEIHIEVWENFQKQTYRNRCQILTSQGVRDMIVPVLRPTSRIPIREIRIDYRERWVVTHLRTLETAYRKAPFFEHYFPALEKVLNEKPDLLLDLNQKLLSLCLKWLRLPVVVAETMTWNPTLMATETDLRSLFEPKAVPEGRFKPYQQVFGSEFVANLSCIDLIFNVGPESLAVIRETQLG